MNLGSCDCASCGVRAVLAVSAPHAWPKRGDVGEAVALAMLRDGWLYYHPTGSWSCPACVARSDHGGAEYRAAARRMVERVRRALSL